MPKNQKYIGRDMQCFELVNKRKNPY